MNILSPFLPKFVRLLLHFSRNCRLHEHRDLLLANRWCWGISIWRDRRLLRRKQFCAPIVVAITQCKPALRLALAATGHLQWQCNSPIDAHKVSPALPASQEANEAATLLATILSPHATICNDFAAVRHAVECNDADIDHHANLADYGELEIAKALARHCVEIGLPQLSFFKYS